MTPSNATGALVAALRQIAMPVAVIAASHGEDRSCATATLMYASIDPPTVVMSLASTSTTLALATRTGSFVVSLLAATQLDMAVTAGKQAGGPDKFAALGIEAVETGLGARLGLPGALAVLVCDLIEQVEAGDHRCCIGAVRDVVTGDPLLLPLVRFRRGYVAPERPTTIDGTYPI